MPLITIYYHGTRRISGFPFSRPPRRMGARASRVRRYSCARARVVATVVHDKGVLAAPRHYDGGSDTDAAARALADSSLVLTPSPGGDLPDGTHFRSPHYGAGIKAACRRTPSSISTTSRPLAGPAGLATAVYAAVKEGASACRRTRRWAGRHSSMIETNPAFPRCPGQTWRSEQRPQHCGLEPALKRSIKYLAPTQDPYGSWCSADGRAHAMRGSPRNGARVLDVRGLRSFWLVSTTAPAMTRQPIPPRILYRGCAPTPLFRAPCFSRDTLSRDDAFRSG